MEKKHEHTYQVAERRYDDSPVLKEVRDYGTPEAKWDEYLLLYCSSCGDVKKTWVKEIKPE